MTKRTFFKRAMAMVACVALAPEIAFGVRWKMAEAATASTANMMWWIWDDKQDRHRWVTSEEFYDLGMTNHPNNWNPLHARLDKEGWWWMGQLNG